MNRSIMASLSALALAASTTAALAAGTAAPSTPVPSTTSAQDAAARHDRRVEAREARMTHALNLLEAKGYGDFTNFRADGKNFDATVTQNGKAVNVVVDPDANQITQQS
jgi:hypothetical protein